MKKMTLLIGISLLAISFLVGCSSESQQKEGETSQASEGSTLTGTLYEVKDFMFVVTNEDGEFYSFDREGAKPEGLENLKVGDTVTVTYTGELSQVDPFTGDVISVEKATS